MKHMHKHLYEQVSIYPHLQQLASGVNFAPTRLEEICFIARHIDMKALQ